MLIEGNYVLTNAHVVWPAADVIVTFTDGTRLEGVPVAGTDLLADLALLGPVTSIAPLPLVDGESLAIGSPLLLIGYPGTTTGALQPTLTETLISRLRKAGDLWHYLLPGQRARGRRPERRHRCDAGW